nr:disease resistance protein RPV1-like [Ziziphus jujuba var. spinosa]
MENWKQWFPVETNNGMEGFPQLKELVVRRCRKLKGKLPHIPSMLSKLVVDDCPELVVSIPRNQMLCELDIENCKEAVYEDEADIMSLRSINISPAAEFQYQAEGFMQGLRRLKDLKVYSCEGMSFLWHDELQQLTCLRHLIIDDSSLQHPTLDGEETRQVELWLPTKVETLELRKCDCLVKVPEGLHLALLQELHIYECPSLISFPESCLPSSLQVLKIEHCKNLISLVHEEEYSNCAATCLESLVIRNCPSLKSISSANGSLPARFKHLSIRYCPTLQCLSWGKLPDNLRNLEIYDCDNLICLSSSCELPEALESFQIWSCNRLESLKATLPKSLKSLLICNCGQLKWITDRFDGNNCLQYIYIKWCKDLRSLPEGLHHLINLGTLIIEKCEKLVSFPQGGLPASNLRMIYVICDNMVAYPRGIQNLIFLKRLEISYSEGFMKVLEEVGFPPNLSSLTIRNLKVCKPLLQWGLHRVTSLRELHLSGEATDMVSFPPEPEEEEEKEEENVDDELQGKMMLPNSLTTLNIESFKNLDRLSAGIQCLTSLQYLSICYCEKLSSFPEGGLPLSLLKLEIVYCPLLEEQCDRDEGLLWPLISHIPCIEYDYRNDGSGRDLLSMVDKLTSVELLDFGRSEGIVEKLKKWRMVICSFDNVRLTKATLKTIKSESDINEEFSNFKSI